MKKQTIFVHDEANPFDGKEVSVIVDNHSKILSTEPYVQEALAAYERRLGNINSVIRAESIGDSTTTECSVESIDGKLSINLSPKHNYVVSNESEIKELMNSVSTVEDGDSKLVVEVAQKNGVYSINTKNSSQLTLKLEMLSQINSQHNQYAYLGKLESYDYGGFVVNVNGLKCFMPCTATTIYKVQNFEHEFTGKTLPVIPVAFSRGNIVVSHKAYMERLIPEALNNLTEDMKQNNMSTHKGVITAVTEHGIFVAFDSCLTGLLSKESMNEETLRAAYVEKTLNYGDEIEFMIGTITQTQRIVLTQTENYKTIWDTIIDTYSVGDNAQFTIQKITGGGIVVCMKGIPEVTAFCKIFGNPNRYAVGNNIQLTITDLDPTVRNISVMLNK